MSDLMYSGPIVYLVHFPTGLFTLTDEYNDYASENYKAHIDKVFQLIKFAQDRDIPIVLEVAHSKPGDMQLELLRRFCAERNVDLDVFRLIHEYPVRSNHLPRIFEELELEPSKVLMAGWTKERCVLNSIEALRAYKKDLEIVLLRGSFTLAARNFKHYNRKEREEFKKVIENTNTKKSALKKALLRINTIRHNPM
jgi:hypothetical protein